MENIDILKDQLRKKIEEERKILGEPLIKEQSLVIQSRLLSMSEYRMAKNVCIYLSIAGEVRTDILLERCRADEKVVCVPAFDKASKKYRLAVYAGKSALARGFMGILEPIGPAWVDHSTVDMIVVPGVAFDETGSRLGRGGGHYDVLLAGMRAFKAAVAFDFQMTPQVPVDEKDVRMDAVITESRVIKAKK